VDLEQPTPLYGETPIDYPIALWDEGVEGTTVLRLRVTDTGEVDSVEVAETSGHLGLDSAAVAGPGTSASSLGVGTGSVSGCGPPSPSTSPPAPAPPTGGDPPGSEDPMSQRHLKPYDDVMDLVGWTPLVRLNRVTRGIRTPVYGKCEFMNPGGSVKDRIGRPSWRPPSGTVASAPAGSSWRPPPGTRAWPWPWRR
jgi:hypothetical protein